MLNKRSFLGGSALLVGFLAFLSLCGGATAATIPVTTTLDQDDGNLVGAVSLREAVRYSADGDTIDLPAGTYILTRVGANEDVGSIGDLDLLRTTGTTLTINGAGAATTIIDGNLTDRVFDVRTGNLALSNLTVTRGSTAPSTIKNGGGIRNDFSGSTVTLTNCTFSNCLASTGAGGGFYANLAGTVLNATGCTFTSCSASGASNILGGGGVFNNSGIINLTSCNFTSCAASGTNGRGGGLYHLFATTATLTNCTFTSCTTVAGGVGGGATFNSGTATLTDCVFTTNTSAGSGGAMFSFVPTTYTRCTYTGNIAGAASAGGAVGVGNTTGVSTFNDCTFLSNSGGFGACVRNQGINCAFNRCTFTSCNAGTSGGAVYNGGAGATTMTLNNCVATSCTAQFGGGFIATNTLGNLITNNSTATGCSAVGASVGGGFFVAAGNTATFNNTNFTSNTANIGAGGFVNGTTTMNGCTISNNTAGNQGGGMQIENIGATLTNCTISSNTCNGNGFGGAFIHAIFSAIPQTVTLTSCTVTGNVGNLGGAIFAQGFNATTGVTESWKSTIIAGNTGTNGQFLSANAHTFLSQGFVIVQNTANMTPFTQNNPATDQLGVDPLLNGLAENGGFTRTHSLQPSSTAIDRGNASTAGATDQRGSGFARIVGTAAVAGGDGSDIGAFERGRNGFIVTNTNDSGAGSLRQAILDANAFANNSGLADLIQFRISYPSPLLRTISPASALPNLSEAVTIDGFTQLGSSVNTLATANNAVLSIEIDGTGAGGGSHGFTSTGGGSTLRGMAINRFGGAAANFPSSSNAVIGCFIGTDATGTIARANGSGVQISGSSGAVGGTLPADRNLITANTGVGIGVASGTGNSISGNLVFNNGGLGIDLGNNGVTPNDSADSDTGANNLQNSPYLTTIVTAAQNTVSGYVDGIAGRNYRINIYANTAFDASGSGEGEVLLGTVASVASGATFSLNYTAIVGKTFITATATDLTTSDSSEFSRRNQAPINNVPPLTANEDLTSPLMVSITDPDSGPNTIQVALTVATGVLTVNTGVPGGVGAGEVAGNSTTAVTINSTVGQINTTLAAGGLGYLSPANFNGPVAFSMTTNDQSFAELGGALTTGPTNATITVIAVPDAPNLTSPAAAALNEGDTIPVVISGSLNDNDGSELLSFRISGVPSALTFSSGSDVGGGVWDFTPAQLAGLTMSANDSGAFALTISAIATEISNSTTATTSAPFAVNAANVAPALNGVTLTASVTENGSVTLDGSFSDPSTSDTYTLVIDWGDPANPPGNIETVLYPTLAGAQPFTLNHTYLDDNPSGTTLDNYTVTISVTDDDSGAATQNFNLPVANSDPTLTGLAVIDVNENDTTTLSGTVNDIGTLDTLTLTIDWGDGNVEDVLFGASATGSQPFSVDHQYLDNNGASPTFTINLTITDDDSGFTNSSIDVAVTNLNPAITAANDPPVILEGSTLVVTVANFTEVGTLDFHNAEIDWGDGTPVDTAGIITEPNAGNGFVGSIDGSHLFDDGPAVYTVTVTVYDNDGGSNTGEFFVTVSNVDPTAVFQKGDPENINFLGVVEFVSQFDPSVTDTTIPPFGLRYSYDYAYNGAAPNFTYGAGDGTYEGSLITASISIPPQFITQSPNHTILGRIIDKDGGFTDYVLRQPDFMSDENDTLLAEGDLGTAFSYTMNADGIPNSIDQPIVYSFEVVDLPEGISTIGDVGLIFDGVKTFSGTFTRQGQITLRMHAVNLAGSDSAYLVITIKGRGSETPQIISKAVAFPNPSLVGAEIEFSVVATDKDGDILSFFWTFGDGTSSRSRVSKHTFATPGTYVATVSVSDGKHDQVFQKINVIVLPADSNTFEISSAKIIFDFKTATRSSLILQGKIPVPSDIVVDGLDIDVSVTDSLYAQTFHMNNKGIGGDTVSQFTLKVAAPGKTQSSSKFTMHLKSTDGSNPLQPSLFQMFTPLGYTNKRVGKPGEEYQFQLVVTMHTPTVVTNFCTITTVYTCVPNKKGTAVKKK